MKKIIFNGCSFVAGDALVWDQYIKLKGLKNLSWEYYSSTKVSDDVIQILQDYKNNYRKFRNLPAFLGKFLKTEVIDISEDGHSNDGISFSTIQTLLDIPEKERKNYHVIVGWTEIHRFIKYSKNLRVFYNINHKTNNLENKAINELKKYIVANTIYNYDEDSYFNYVRNIIMLENFLKANHCTYTFYRNIGIPNDGQNFNIRSAFTNLKYQESKSVYSDNSNWFKFSDNGVEAMNGDSLSTAYLYNKPHNHISEINGHPNLKVILEFSNKLVNFIRNQNVGF